MPTEDAYSSGHLVPSHLGLACSTCRDKSFSRTCPYFSGLCTSNMVSPPYFLDFEYKVHGPGHKVIDLGVT